MHKLHALLIAIVIVAVGCQEEKRCGKRRGGKCGCGGGGPKAASTVASPAPMDQAVMAQVDAMCSAGRLYAALDILADTNRNFPPSVAQAVADHLVTRLLREGRYDEVRRVTGSIGELTPRREGFRELVVLADILMEARERDVEDAIESFRENAGRLSDVYLVRAARSILRAAGRDSEPAAELGEFVVTELPRRQDVVSAVAVPYVSAALRDKDLKIVVERLEQLSETSLSAKERARVYSMCGYELIGAETNPLIDRFVKIAGQVVWRVPPEDPNRVRLARQLFDSHYVLNDLQSASLFFEIAFENERKNAPETYEGIRQKFLAHRAINSEDHAAAIEHIRRFMEWVANAEDDQYDPTTGATVPMGLILGLNTTRIGDELIKMGDEEAAGRAYDEAVTLYEGALATLEKKSATYIRGSAELKALKKKR